MGVIVHFHTQFLLRLEGLRNDPELRLFAADVLKLVDALAEHGRAIEGEASHDASHPVVTSRYQMFALRRTPRTVHTPDARRPPVLRIPYVWFTDVPRADEVAVVMTLGDKTCLGNHWYPPVVAEIETRLIPAWCIEHPEHQPLVRRTR